ncbi:MAG: gliding motility-associated C-terminal domain-containing protein [Flavobacteriaceae bacterium]|nr:gliding motility-associated C-terminal domain-containing protein [Flavobacteriaceae bacterium]
MKKTILGVFSFLLLVFFPLDRLQAQLAAGDISFIGYNTDSGGGTSDSFSFIVLTDIAENELIYFTDEGWRGFGGGGWSGSQESHLEYETPAGGLSCGDIVTIKRNGAAMEASSGDVEELISQNSGSLDWDLSDGDQVLAYQASSIRPANVADITFIAGIHGDDGQNGSNRLDTVTGWSEDATYVFGVAHSIVPPGLTSGSNCVALFPAANSEKDNARYNSSLVGVSATLLSNINNSANWESRDSGPYDIDPSDFSPNVFCGVPDDPDVPSLSFAPATPCSGDTVTVTITGDLNDAEEWKIYTGSCGDTEVDSTSSGSFEVSPTGTTTYFVRGEGTFITAGGCGQVTVAITLQEDASFSYPQGSYCNSDSDPTPTITGELGGTFSASPAGLSIDSSTGVVDLSASLTDDYTVTYTTSGACPGTSTFDLSVTTVADASFNYDGVGYCKDGTDPVPENVETGGGTWSATPSGLSINAVTGEIDLSASDAQAYEITYTISGSCGASDSVFVFISDVDDPSFGYSKSSFCINEGTISPTVTGSTGGAFTAAPNGLSIDDSNGGTGDIDLGASTAGTYVVTYQTSGTCSKSDTFEITVLPMDDASFSYAKSAYCVSESDPIPTITGDTPGSFSATPAGLNIAANGTIDLSDSTPGNYTITYTTSFQCSTSSTFNMEIKGMDDADFNYDAAAYCRNGVDPMPTVNLAGGSFSSSPAGLVIDSGTGAIDVSASTAATYTVTYTTAGDCPNSSSISVTINALDDASFSYSASNILCTNQAAVSPTVSTAGGSFSVSGSGLSIDLSTGVISPSSSAPGSYSVTYTTADTCINSQAINITIESTTVGSFAYNDTNFCLTGSDPIPTFGGTGTFSGSSGLVIDSDTGEIDLSASEIGAHTVTFMPDALCPVSASSSIVISDTEDASFSYASSFYAPTDTDPTPTVSGVGGGVFSGTTGLVIDSTTGIIDLAASTLGVHTITYTTPGICFGSANVVLTLVEDNVPPVAFNIRVDGAPPASAPSIRFVLECNETLATASLSDFELEITGAAAATMTTATVSGNTVIVEVENISGTGSLQLNLKENNSLTDNFNNGNGNNGYTAAFVSGDVHEVDREAPSIQISAIQSSPTSEQPIVFSIRSSELIVGLSEEDLEITNGGFESFIEITPGLEYQCELFPHDEGSVVLSLPEGSVADIAGNPNTQVSGEVAYRRRLDGEQLKDLPSTLVTPNGDGKNDFWVIDRIEEFPENKVRVYNASGQTVYRSSGYENQWNGRLNNGSKELPVGLYYYYIIFTPDGNPIKGTLYIMH